MKITNIFKAKRLIVVANFILFLTAMVQIHVNTKITLMGYDIGELKNEEMKLMEEKSNLKIRYSNMTRKENLILMSHTDIKGKETKKLAAR